MSPIERRMAPMSGWPMPTHVRTSCTLEKVAKLRLRRIHHLKRATWCNGATAHDVSYGMTSHSFLCRDNKARAHLPHPQPTSMIATTNAIASAFIRRVAGQARVCGHHPFRQNGHMRPHMTRPTAHAQTHVTSIVTQVVLQPLLATFRPREHGAGRSRRRRARGPRKMSCIASTNTVVRAPPAVAVSGLMTREPRWRGDGAATSPAMARPVRGNVPSLLFRHHGARIAPAGRTTRHSKRRRTGSRPIRAPRPVKVRQCASHVSAKLRGPVQAAPGQACSSR